MQQSLGHYVAEPGTLCRRAWDIMQQSLEHYVAEPGTLCSRAWDIMYVSEPEILGLCTEQWASRAAQNVYCTLTKNLKWPLSVYKNESSAHNGLGL